MVKRDIEQTITFIKKYLLKNYNYFVIDINDKFIGCKFYDSNNYIFYVSLFNNKMSLTYRNNFVEKDCKHIIEIEKYSDEKLKKTIDKIVKKANIFNLSLEKPKKRLKNALVNYQNGKKQSSVKDNIDTDNLTFDELKSISLNDIVISNRLKNVLMNNNITNLHDLIDYNPIDLINQKNMGKKSIQELEILINKINKKIGKSVVFLTKSSKKNHEKEMIDQIEQTIKEKVRISQYNNVLIDNLNISVRLKNALKNNHINTLKDFLENPIKELSNYSNIGRASIEEAIKYKQKIIEDNTFSDDNSNYLYGIIKEMEVLKPVSVISLKNYLMSRTNYPTDKLMNDLSILRQNGKIEFSMDGIRIKHPKLKTLIETKFNQQDADLLTKRFNGNTLEEIAKQRNITRERVRQKIVKLVKKFPIISEDKYKDVFEKYCFSKDEFCELFNVDAIVYYYLKERYKIGGTKLIEALNDDRFSEHQKQMIQKYFKIIKVNGNDIVINKLNIINELIKQYAISPMKIEKFTSIYNSFCKSHPDYNLDLSDGRNMEGIIIRANNTILDLGKTFRYYDYESVGKKEYEELKKLFNLETGYYSTLIIYKNNTELMNSLDIRNEYELHNFSKNMIKIRNIDFDRMPNFSVNKIRKSDFFEEKIKELSPISLNDFLEIMESEFGHKSSALFAYINSTFSNYLDGGILKNNISILPEWEIEKLKEYLNKPIYNLDDLKVLLKLKGFENVDDIITNPNMYKIGYKIRSSYILRKDINSIEDYMRNMVAENDFIPNDNYLKNSTYTTFMKRIEKTYDIFLISPNEYITIKKLNSLGIFKEDIEYFCETIKSVFKSQDYFTLSNVRKNIEIRKLDDFGFDDIFLENIISNIDGITSNHFSNNKIYSFINKSFDSAKFILDMIGLRNSIFIDELQNEISERYGIDVTQERIKRVIMNTDMYYSDELNKIYLNKDYYYEEVYHE